LTDIAVHNGRYLCGHVRLLVLTCL
jgi:hypothetical protein